MLQETIFGRENEIKILDKLWKSSEAEFLAIYGRRRVGKTHLIREYFSRKKCLYLEIMGQKDGRLEDQLQNFINVFSKTFSYHLPLQPPTSWKMAFEMLSLEIEKLSKAQNIVIFLDELPWLTTKRSGLLQALDYYWNRIWSRYPNLILVVCGSAASWMLDHLINAKGGLHNRLTKTILLKPYDLKGTQSFLTHRGLHLNAKQVLDLYMVFGGVPYYLRQIDKGQSALQLVNKVCFQPDGLLYDEFNRLFHSLFTNAEDHLAIIKAIAKHQQGISRQELCKAINMTSGGTLNKRISELESAGFIQTYVPYGSKVKNQYYRVIDEYCYFYLRWIEPFKNKGVIANKDYWQTKGKTAAATAWAGYAFENICLKHIHQIAASLGLQSIACEVGSWRYIPKTKKELGAQIDLLFDRDDGVVTLCEIKYSEKPFVVDKSEAKTLLNKIEVFEKHSPIKKQILLAFITTAGMKPTPWAEELVHNLVTLDNLFK